MSAAALGGLCGFTWAGALRSVMVEVATFSQFSWSGTFLGILLPGTTVGALLGVAWARGSSGRTERLGWFAAAPLLFAVTAGVGQVVAAVGLIAGGFALSGLVARRRVAGGGRRALHMVCSVAAAGFVIALAISIPTTGGHRLAATSPRGAWVITLAVALVLLGMLAAAIPFSFPSGSPATEPVHTSTDRGEVSGQTGNHAPNAPGGRAEGGRGQ